MKYSIITSIAMTAFSSFALGANVPVDILRRQYGETSYGSGESAPAPAPAPAPEAAPAAAASSGPGY
ncbi:hypothetical protein DSO57_1029292 [Entomophthora muscae]|uniref:Uncharacterized protein n=2 Tax=Entomophthora muscae TaxID=34485 RepID=A0ACC2UMH7_9FUNG|nr:hypothetical protein DSO57_1029290 [Entomophthora muscae]KAJ9087811.1 hypothetical protein DSO57_1029292 [Entomophthora muscae]